jgi:hypothetical protein
MKKSINLLFAALLLGVFAFAGCTKDTPVEPQGTTVPKILNLSADKMTIKFGGGDPTVITCQAEGGSLEYKWEVDLGDIFPLTTDNSKVRFTGSPCCIGEKYIKCTVTNDKGSITQIITILIEK